jgi:hypothetical protein
MAIFFFSIYSNIKRELDNSVKKYLKDDYWYVTAEFREAINHMVKRGRCPQKELYPLVISYLRFLKRFEHNLNAMAKMLDVKEIRINIPSQFI